MLIESMKQTLVGYDQWHPSMLTSAIRRGAEESQLLVSASINANSTVLGLIPCGRFFGWKPVGDSGMNLAVQPLDELGVEQAAVVAAGYDLDFGVADQRDLRLPQQLDRPFEVERIHVAHDHVELALELGAERRPVFLEDQPDIIGFPRPGDLSVDGAGGAVPELARTAVTVERAEDRLERAKLTSSADHVVHPRETVFMTTSPLGSA